MVRQAPVICVMVPPIHLGAWSMALMLWLPFELLLCTCYIHVSHTIRYLLHNIHNYCSFALVDSRFTCDAD